MGTIRLQCKIFHHIQDWVSPLCKWLGDTSLSENGSVPAGIWIATGVGAFVALAALVIMAISDEKSPVMGICAIVCYVALSNIDDINISIAGNKHGTKFEPACVVLIVEVGKLIVSMILYTMNRWPKIRNGEPFLQENFNMKDVLFLSIPACLFASFNIIQYFALGLNDMASFGVFRDTVIFFTAICWSVVFKAELGMKRYLTLAVLFAGLCINQIGPLLSSTVSWSILIILGMTMLNAIAGVSNEFAIKRNASLDLNMQNSVLYSFCCFFAIVYMMVLHPNKLSSIDSFFEDFDKTAWIITAISLTMGLLVSRMLKYADSVTKAVGSCLRGPILIFASPLIGLHSRLDFAVGCSSFIVAASACYFLLQGRPEPGINMEKEN